MLLALMSHRKSRPSCVMFLPVNKIPSLDQDPQGFSSVQTTISGYVTNENYRSNKSIFSYLVLHRSCPPDRPGCLTACLSSIIIK